ncbi:MAG: serine/threonine protein kinase [Cyanobacteria bacterium HKST-UBA02]|nr:serine/threonine protein kinase [Cyanobacteria bacterium HKST-UBA02]
MTDQEKSLKGNDLSLFGEADPLVGKTLEGRFDILDCLGEGSLSTAYEAVDKSSGRAVILKKVHKHLIEGMRNLKKFEQKLKQLSTTLKGNNICNYNDAFIASDGTIFLVMDSLSFESLEDLLSKSGHISIERAVNLFKQVTMGLEQGESCGYQHRDLKPSNIVILNNEQFVDDVRLVDFGIARILAEESEHNKSAQYITHSQEVFGSPLYLSPEQCTGKRLDQRSDIYSLGCVMYEAITGKPPFVGKNVLETAYKHMNEPPREIELEDADQNLLSRFQTVVFKCLAKEPDERYQNVTDLKTDLNLMLVAQSDEWEAQARAFQISLPLRKRRLGIVPISSELVLFLLLTMILIGVPVFWVTTSFGSTETKYPPFNNEMLWVVQNKTEKPDLEGYGPRREAAIDALELVREEQGPESEEYAKALGSLIELYYSSGHWKEAEDKIRELLKLPETIVGPFSPAQAYQALGYVCFMQDKFDDSEKACLEAVSRMETESLQQKSKIQPLRVLGDIYARRGDLEKGRATFDKLFTIVDATKETDPGAYADTASKLADMYRRMGKYQESERFYRLGIDWWRSHGKIESAYAAKSLYGLGLVLTAQNKYDESETIYKEALEMSKATLGARSGLTGAIRKRYVEALWRTKPWEALKMQLSEGNKEAG